MRHDASMWGRVKKIEQRFARPKEPDQDCGLSGWKEWPGAQRTCTRTWRTRCRQTFLLSTIFFSGFTGFTGSACSASLRHIWPLHDPLWWSMKIERSDCSSKCFGVQERQRNACASEVYLGTSGTFCHLLLPSTSFLFFLSACFAAWWSSCVPSLSLTWQWCMWHAA